MSLEVFISLKCSNSMASALDLVSFQSYYSPSWELQRSTASHSLFSRFDPRNGHTNVLTIVKGTNV